MLTKITRKGEKMENKNAIIEAMKKEISDERETEKFEKRLRKKKKKIKKSQKRIKELLAENAKLKRKVKRSKKKYQELKKTLQIERYNFGFNPFFPTNTYRLLKNDEIGKKQKSCVTVPYFISCSKLRKNSDEIIEGNYREV